MSCRNDALAGDPTLDRPTRRADAGGRRGCHLSTAGRITHTNQIDAVLHPKAVKSTYRRAVFVGAEAYEAAGGKISRDLLELQGI